MICFSQKELLNDVLVECFLKKGLISQESIYKVSRGRLGDVRAERA